MPRSWAFRQAGLGVSVVVAACAGRPHALLTPAGRIGFPSQVGAFYLANQPRAGERLLAPVGVYFTDDSAYTARVSIHAPESGQTTAEAALDGEWKRAPAVLKAIGIEHIRVRRPPVAERVGSTVGDSSRFYPGLRASAEFGPNDHIEFGVLFLVYMGDRCLTIAVTQARNGPASSVLGQAEAFANRFVLAHALGSRVPPL